MNPRLSLFLYNLLFPFALLAMLPNLLMRLVRRGNYQRKFGQRFGIYDPQLQARLGSGEWIWIHSISVGETFLALKLAQKMRTLDPAILIVLSVTTSTGFALAEKSATGWLEVIYNPLDALPFVHRALKFVRPAQLIFVEAMWPNLLLGAKKRGIPVIMIPRLSERSERRFRKFRFFTGGFFGAFDCMCAQEPEDPPRLESVGADPEKIQVTGSIKFDHADDKPSTRVAEFRALVKMLGVKDGSPILLAGSTFQGEEKILADMFVELRHQFPDLFLILVPRHVERTPEVIAEIKPLGFRIARRSTLANRAMKADCLIVDTTGELRDWYHLASVVFIGKSLTSFGGQNPVEAAVAGKPVIFGPHMENFRNIVQLLLARKAAIQVANPLELKSEIERLLALPQLLQEMSGRAHDALVSHQGATERAAKLLLGMRKSGTPRQPAPAV